MTLIAAVLNIAIIGVAIVLIVTGTMRAADRRKPKSTGWSPPASLTDEDLVWLGYHERLDLEGWVAYQSRQSVGTKSRDSLPGAAVMREKHIEAIDPDQAMTRIERALNRGGGDVSSHDVIAVTRAERMKIVSHNLDGSCVIELRRASGSLAYLQATRELMMQITGASLPGRRGSCKFHAWSTVHSGDGTAVKTTCIDCGADYNNPREWNGGW